MRDQSIQQMAQLDLFRDLMLDEPKSSSVENKIQSSFESVVILRYEIEKRRSAKLYDRAREALVAYGL